VHTFVHPFIVNHSEQEATTQTYKTLGIFLGSSGIWSDAMMFFMPLVSIENL